MKIGSIVSALALVVAAGAANAAVIAQWTIVNAFPTSPIPTGSYSVGAADIGVQTAGSSLNGVHSVAATQYTSPVGNGSARSFSSNNWSIGDYYEAVVSTTGYDTITIAWDQTRSSTGPATFDLTMSVDGGASFVILLNDYTVVQTGGGLPTWTSGTALTTTSLGPVAAGASASNVGSVIFRLVAQVAGSATTGTNRIDNVTIAGNIVPSPGALALAGLGGLIAVRRRRA